MSSVGEATIDHRIQERREYVFLILAGLFLGAMTMLNVIGITRFVQVGPLSVAVGVLPYPITFLCTDLIGELYGRARASLVVWVGLGLNFVVLAVVYIGNFLPSVPAESQPPWQSLVVQGPVYLPNGEAVNGAVDLFHFIYACTSGAVVASMVAYLAAQFCDVYLFHFWRNLTKGKHLWLRNNLSTTVSQFVDAVAVVSITFGAAFYRGEMTLKAVLTILVGNYAFKAIAALLDTPFFYLGVKYLGRYLYIDPLEEFQNKNGNS